MNQEIASLIMQGKPPQARMICNSHGFVLKIIIIMLAVVANFVAQVITVRAESQSEKGIVRSGAAVRVHFTCRLGNGETAISTYQALAKDTSIPKSTIFLERDRDTPIKLVAEKNPPRPERPNMMGFESWLLYRLSSVLVGLTKGEKTTIEINAERLDEHEKGEHSIKMARIRQRPKEVRMTPEEYRNRTGKTPEPGQTYTIDPAFPGKVFSTTENEVLIGFNPENKTKVVTPLGEGAVKEHSDRFDVVINAQPGTLVRSGGIVGRIVNIDERFITIDYGHPFGGETLFCDVLVLSDKQDQDNASGSSVLSVGSEGKQTE